MFGTPNRPNHLFVVRLWRESQTGQPEAWRGSVEHIPTGQRLYFVSLADLSDFIGFRMTADSASLKTKELELNSGSNPSA